MDKYMEWQERAAIREFDGGFFRKQAERQAEIDIRRIAERELKS